MAASWTSTGICYIDAFAGPGIYEDGSPGSPIIALDAACQDNIRQYNTDIELVFIEKEHERFDHLKSMIDNYCARLPNQCHVTPKRGACEEILPGVLDKIHTLQPVFVNFDGWGVDTPYTLIRKIGQRKASEVFITFHSSWFTRFAKCTDIEAGDIVFGSNQWREVTNLKNPREKKPFLVDKYRQSLLEAGFQFQLTFELIDEGGHSLFLVFGTNSADGVEKMKDAMWQVDKVAGSKFKDPRDPNQLKFDLSNDNPNLTLLSEQILHQLDQAPKSLTELQRFTLLETLFKKSHAKKAVDQLEADQKVIRKHTKKYEESIVQKAPDRLF